MSDDRRPIRLWFDFTCPWSYCFRVRLEKLRKEFSDRLKFEFCCFPLEIVNKAPLPKELLEAEWPLCAMQEPAAKFRNWSEAEWKWPETMLPAFEAEKCAEARGDEQAAGFQLAVHQALFWDSQTISMRHVLFEIAAECGLDVGRFAADFDSGEMRKRVMADLEEAKRVGVKGTPGLVLPSGRVLSNFTFTMPRFTPDHKVARVTPPEYTPDAALAKLREVLNEAAGA
jgi:predicted DsbA family dithiol-disulfide isomerase